MSSLPPLYETWLAQILPGAIPSEKKATCDNCPMCSRPSKPSSTSILYFNPRVRCCSYLPEIFNFQAGRILLDTDSAHNRGKISLERRVKQKEAVTPLGLGQTAFFKSQYTPGDPASFGQSEALLCPHYIQDGNLCGIWHNRNSVCATWFCKHERGAVGSNFWTTLQQLLKVVETSLSEWCVTKLELDNEASKALFTGNGIPIGQFPPLSAKAQITYSYEEYWGKWVDREQEYFRECASLVNPLDWNEVREICGPVINGYISILGEAYRELLSTSEFPIFLKTGSFEIIETGVDFQLVETYRPFDLFKLSNKLANLLPYFNGRKVEAALLAIETELGIILSREEIRELLDYRLLIEAEE